MIFIWWKKSKFSYFAKNGQSLVVLSGTVAGDCTASNVEIEFKRCFRFYFIF